MGERKYIGKVVPKKGEDYFTEEERNEIVDEVIALLPVYDGEQIPFYNGEVQEE